MSIKRRLQRLEEKSVTGRVQEGDPAATRLEGIGIGKELIGLTYGEASDHIAEKISSIESDRPEYKHPEIRT